MHKRQKEKIRGMRYFKVVLKAEDLPLQIKINNNKKKEKKGKKKLVSMKHVLNICSRL